MRNALTAAVILILLGSAGIARAQSHSVVLAVRGSSGQSVSWEECMRRGDALFDKRLLGEAERAYSEALQICQRSCSG